jgi:hypothetical protein
LQNLAARRSALGPAEQIRDDLEVVELLLRHVDSADRLAVGVAQPARRGAFPAAAVSVDADELVDPEGVGVLSWRKTPAHFRRFGRRTYAAAAIAQGTTGRISDGQMKVHARGQTSSGTLARTSDNALDPLRSGVTAPTVPNQRRI